MTELAGSSTWNGGAPNGFTTFMQAQTVDETTWGFLYATGYGNSWQVISKVKMLQVLPSGSGAEALVQCDGTFTPIQNGVHGAAVPANIVIHLTQASPEDKGTIELTVLSLTGETVLETNAVPVMRGSLRMSGLDQPVAAVAA